MKVCPPSHAGISGFVHYAAHADGRIWSHRAQRYLKPLNNPNGYQHVVLCNESGKHRMAVHRVIANSYLGEAPLGAVINHKNGIRGDNRADNLEWCTQSENVLHAYKNGFRTINEVHRERASKLGIQKRKLADEDVREIRRTFTGKRGDITRLSIKYGIDRKGISSIVTGRSYTEVA